MTVQLHHVLAVAAFVVAFNPLQATSQLPLIDPFEEPPDDDASARRSDGFSVKEGFASFTWGMGGAIGRTVVARNDNNDRLRMGGGMLMDLGLIVTPYRSGQHHLDLTVGTGFSYNTLDDSDERLVALSYSLDVFTLVSYRYAVVGRPAYLSVGAGLNVAIMDTIDVVGFDPLRLRGSVGPVVQAEASSGRLGLGFGMRFTRAVYQEQGVSLNASSVELYMRLYAGHLGRRRHVME